MRRFVTLAAILMMVPLLAAAGITVDVTRQPAAKVFDDIMRQSGKNFIYPSSLLKDLKVTVKAADEPLDAVLGRMFAGTGITYRILGDNVLLSGSGNGAHAARGILRVSGFVREAGSGEPLIGALVRDTTSKAVTTSNASGFYSLAVSPGTTCVIVSYPGYEHFSSGNIDVSANMVMDVDLGFSHRLDEVTVIETKNHVNDMRSPHPGGFSMSQRAITSVPVIFGESDVIKALQLQPGVSAGMEGLAGMYVHGGNSDENLYMLDNIPLYQVNHLGGLYSAFNTEAVKDVEFYKSSFPARYDGRLSSFMDVHTKDGSMEGHHGSFRLGLTSGAFNIDGPLRRGTTTYSLAVRRSWLEVFSIPVLAIANSAETNDHTDFRYAFMDVNAKVTHRFSPRSSAHVMFYYGDDYLRTGSKWRMEETAPWSDEEKYRMHWGNIVASAGWNYVFSPSVFGEFTGAFSRYYSTMKHDYTESVVYNSDGSFDDIRRLRDTDNNISDWIFRADFNWHPAASHSVDFGASFTHHSFLPARSVLTVEDKGTVTEMTDSLTAYHANEFNAYISDDWILSPSLRVNAGLHASLFAIDGHTRYGVSPRVAVCYNPSGRWSLKASYSRAVQYVHQLTQSYLSLPTDQWVPVTGDFRPQSSDKVSVGAYLAVGQHLTLSAEAYYKWMHNLVEYRDEYYLIPPQPTWESQLVSGRGTAKGADIKISKETGRLTGHVAYSLMWADRTFPDRNGGRTYPARFDNRHKINILLNWKINDRWEIGASWTGMSGNRFTLPVQNWQGPDFGSSWGPGEYKLITGINNYRLPFYHRLDLSFTRHTRHGFWNFSFYNAYCHMNVAGVRFGDRHGRPVFQQFHLFPIIPSISYTWTF